MNPLRRGTDTAEVIARQEADKRRLNNIIKSASNPRVKSKAITKADVAAAVRDALEDVARELRFKAKETPGWASAYNSACVAIEKRLSDLK